MIQHWLSCHRELSGPPKFRMKVVRSSQNAMKRQISEAVRIELRGEHVLNSLSEYSMCKIQEDWRMKKREEKNELEPKIIDRIIEVNEDGDETVIVLE